MRRETPTSNNCFATPPNNLRAARRFSDVVDQGEPRSRRVRPGGPDVRELLAITAPPLYSRVLRGDCGIPQPEEGYPKLLTWRNELCATHRGLHVCGFGWDGIGINDMIRMAARAAGEIMAGQGYQTMEAPVKGVYF